MGTLQLSVSSRGELPPDALNTACYLCQTALEGAPADRPCIGAEASAVPERRIAVRAPDITMQAPENACSFQQTAASSREGARACAGAVAAHGGKSSCACSACSAAYGSSPARTRREPLPAVLSRTSAGAQTHRPR